ncbi:MAG: HDOD domain-containing protein [Betaproteobacteria bacterium]|jgi:c-di-GMP-related signal transduction protein|nr:HDOD domain-containing protein [Betaproteobacteria bacterium]MBK7654087.1 HDOD domain-containing protein [Betaproteobacteria bacterium]MBP6646738.1 HDOD domain-containing protein [Burkholderiaceae bacterium]
MATPPDSPEAAAEAQVETTTALARQSILDEKGDVFGYELFDRSTQGHHHSAQTDATVLFRVLSNAGADALFGRKNLFINCTHESLTGLHLELVNPTQVVLEVPPVALHDPLSIETLSVTMAELRTRGFRLAFDHTALTRPYASWLALASFVKLDPTQVKPELLETLVKHAQRSGSVKLIADKVETAEQQALLKGFGVKLFQGYWFSRPVKVTAKLVSPAQATIVELINLVRKNAESSDIEALLKKDPTLSFNLLRFINSSGFGLNVEITSFRHAVMILGMKKLFRWAAMLLTAARKDGTPSALGHMAVLRGRLMENLVGDLLSKEDADNAFVVGVFSLLDAMLGMPMDQALESLSLPEPVTDALLNDAGIFAPFLRMAKVCETNSEDEVNAAADSLAMTSHQVNMAHLEALVWTEELLGGQMT